MVEEWRCLDSTSDRQKSGNDLDNWYLAMRKMDRQFKNENGQFKNENGSVLDKTLFSNYLFFFLKKSHLQTGKITENWTKSSG